MNMSAPERLEDAVYIFKYKTVWKWTMAAICLPMAGLFLWVGSIPFTRENPDLISTFFLLGISLTMIVLCILGTIEYFIGQVILKNDIIVHKYVGGTRELNKSEIASFRIVPGHSISFLPTPASGKKKIKLSVYFDELPKLLEWACENLKFDNVDEIQKEENEVLEDKDLGFTKQQRIEALEQANKSFRPVELTGYVLLVWSLFFPSFEYSYLAISLAVYPWIIVAIVKIQKGAIRFDGKEGGKVPKAASPFLLVCIAILVRALLDFHLINIYAMIFPALLIGTILTGALFFAAKDLRKKLGIVVLTFIACLFYGYGAAVLGNSLLDDSHPQLYDVKILEKRVSSGKHTSYYIKLTSWGPMKTDDEVDVGKSFYSQVSIGDTIQTRLRPGKLGVMWFTVKLKEVTP